MFVATICKSRPHSKDGSCIHVCFWSIANDDVQRVDQGKERASSGRKIEDRWRLSCHQEAGNFLNICICIYICICVCVCVCICIRICKIRYSVLAATGGSRLAIGREYIRHDMTFAFDDKGRCLAEKFNQSQSQPGMTIYPSHIQRQDIGNQVIELTN